MSNVIKDVPPQLAQVCSVRQVWQGTCVLKKAL